MIKGQGHKLGLCFLTSDLGVTALSWVGAYFFRFSTELIPAPRGTPPFQLCAAGLPLILLMAAVAYSYVGLYEFHRLRMLRQELPGVLKANGLLFLLLVSVTFYRRDLYESRLAIGLFLSFNVPALTVVRRVAWLAVHFLRRRGYNPSRAVVVGSGRLVQRIVQALRENSWTGLQVVGIVDDRPAEGVDGLPVLGNVEELESVVERTKAAYVFVALPMDRYAELRTVFDALSDSLVDVRLVPEMPSLAATTLAVSELDGLPIVAFGTRPHDGWNPLIKRAMDIAITIAAMVVLAPVMLLIALVVKLTSRGPVLFRQERASLDGRPFQMLKFRSMRVDAEHATGPVWAIEDDPRRTRLGAFLRRTSLDELPQLFNVLRGEMSIVGPRPERPHFIEKFRRSVPHYMLRHRVKAGITGWAQVHGWRGNTSLRKRVQYDLYYISNWTPWLDVRIIFLTLFRGLTNRNAY